MKKQKPTLQEKLIKRKYKVPNRFFLFIYHFIMSYLVAPKYKPNYTIVDDINKCKGPCFLIWNHLSRLDHAYVMQATYPRRISILAGYNEFFRSHLHFAFRLMHILPKKNFTSDIIGTKAMASIIKQEGCVCFSPEGMSSIYGTNQPIVSGTGHFLKHYKIPVYFLQMRGQYLTNTKVCLDERYGRTEAKLMILFNKEDLERMTAKEIEDKINLEFKHDDYEWNKTEHIKWENNGKICEKLNEICYKCPKCGAEIQMEAKDNYIKCKVCGSGAHMNDYYEVIPFDENSKVLDTPSKWVAWEREEIIKEIRANDNYIFTEEVKLGKLPKYKLLKNLKTTEICGEGIFSIDHNGLHYKGTKDGLEWEASIDYKKVYTLIIVTDTSYFSLYINDEYYEFYPKNPSVIKALLLTEEMHRLHVNTWKNFPWNDYMYLDK